MSSRVSTLKMNVNSADSQSGTSGGTEIDFDQVPIESLVEVYDDNKAMAPELDEDDLKPASLILNKTGMTSTDYLTALGWYFLFGVLHEIFHFASAISLGLIDFSNDVPQYCISFLTDIFLHRQISFPYSGLHIENMFDWRLFIVRHIGWLSSLTLAIYLHVKERRNNLSSPASSGKAWCITAAYLTAMDAISTDLLGIQKLVLFPMFYNWDTLNLGVNDNSVTLYCGNFGVLLLHEAWLNNGGKSALDIIEKMVEVTMMRGAQSGGVVTFDEKKSGKESALVGTRSRTIKSKRETLSTILRTKMEKDTRSLFSCLKSKPTSKLTKFYAGHTRFATTSKATFDGTHPHQWTEPRHYLAYNMEESFNSKISDNMKQHVPSTLTRIENFITHNGDFEFWEMNGKIYDTEAVQLWLELATGAKMPTVVDSAAIAGMVDLIRCKGCFGLSVRYAVCLGLPTSEIPEENLHALKYPTHSNYEELGKLFEAGLEEYQRNSQCSLEVLGSNPEMRLALAMKVTAILENSSTSLLSQWLNNEEEGAGLYEFSVVVINAFFDNDLFNTVKIFLASASGSFGLCVMSSLDSHRQVCIAARGQTMSLALYPNKHTILWGSEQAAVKSGMGVDFPGKRQNVDLHRSILNVETDVLRLDLDDLNGEICLIDWGAKHFRTPAVSLPNRNVKVESVMSGSANLYLFQESKSVTQPDKLYHRMTKLTKNELITDLKDDIADPILKDLQDIPQICQAIQNDWNNVRVSGKSSTFSLNRLTAWNLGRCLKAKLDRYVSGSLVPTANRVDILVTGCEVSLWLAEQFASDLQKAFPKLRITPISSNKLLGLYGQDDINVPTIGHPISETALDLDDAITIIVSHSGGTFSPLGCSSLFQSKTKNIFVIASEWDTQIGKQLRSGSNNCNSFGLSFDSRIFVTGVGMRTAEPCSISVVATHQILTNILEYISVVVLSDNAYRKVTGALITETDLQILERCNKDNVFALEDIVGVNRKGIVFPPKKESTEKELRAAGDIWSDHILEGAKAMCMTFVYVVGTVTSGYPIATAIAYFAGLDSVWGKYVVSFIDSLIFFWIGQINIIILRLIQRRSLLHRMVGRTVVIGDIPWVAQSAEAFLGKIFACSYSVAGLNVLSANPSDHLVHRMTHRVVRGSLLICGRPDGRLSALTAMESSVSLSVNQASSIQSLGSTCESVTIGHNPFKLPLSAKALFLKRFRPLFLCEHLLGEEEEDLSADYVSNRAISSRNLMADNNSPRAKTTGGTFAKPETFLEETVKKALEEGMCNLTDRPSYKEPTVTVNEPTEETGDSFSEPLQEKNSNKGSITGSIRRSMKGAKKKPKKAGVSSAALLGKFKTISNSSAQSLGNNHFGTLQAIVEESIQEKKWSDGARQLFETLDEDNNAVLERDEFIAGLLSLNSSRCKIQLGAMFDEYSCHKNGVINFDQFYTIMSMNALKIEQLMQPSIRDSDGLIRVRASTEKIFGERLIEDTAGDQEQILLAAGATKSQNFAQELYESRIASMQRFVSMTVMFHQMGWRVQHFFSFYSCGLLGYRMDRTHSIMRIATTASPISGADVRDRKQAIFFMRKVQNAVDVISNAYSVHKAKKVN